MISVSIFIVFNLSDFILFFQAEDGIRYLTVTGVQTCALPILTIPAMPWVSRPRFRCATAQHGVTTPGRLRKSALPRTALTHRHSRLLSRCEMRLLKSI